MVNRFDAAVAGDRETILRFDDFAIIGDALLETFLREFYRFSRTAPIYRTSVAALFNIEDFGNSFVSSFCIFVFALHSFLPCKVGPNDWKMGVV